MVEKYIKSHYLILIVLALAFLVRMIDLSFPSFTSDEARVAFRGHTLATIGKDELGRPFPLLFNSLEDYQLPVVSYLVAGGEFVFGKSEFGARVPFILIGTLLVLLTYQIAKFFSPTPLFWLTSALVVAFSPGLIFLSKVPNQAIVLTFIFALLFYLLINKKNFLFVALVMIISVLTSKQAWFILLPFTFFTVIFYQKSFNWKRKLIQIGFSALLVFLAFSIFLSVPQAKRSLLENNFLIFSDITIKNGIDRLRGQGLEAGWPALVARILFNKLHFLTVGFFHWLSNISPATYFGQLDNSGRISYFYLGAWAKILIVPFSLGLFFLIRKGDQQKKALLLYFLVLTFSSFFVYPNSNLEAVYLTLPFMALVISFGFEQLNKKITILILFLMITEVMINIFILTPDYRNTTALRPIWIKGLTRDIFEKSKVYKVAVSDDIVSDIVSYIEWYTQFDPPAGFLQVNSPYKFRQYRLANIKIVGSDETFTTCSKDEHMETFVSSRDLDKIKHQFDINIIKTYKNSNEEDKAFLIEKACIK